MPRVTIYTKDGTKEVEVNERFAEAYKGLETEDRKQHEKEKSRNRRHPTLSMNTMTDSGYRFADPGTEYVWDDVLAQIDLAQQVHARIAELPTRQAEVVQLYLRGFTEAQIARKLKISKPAITKLKNKLKNKFADFLE